MAEDWFADVRRYDPDADENVVALILRHCGIALTTRDASLVSFSDSKETGRVRDNFLRKKLALTDDDATLDAGITAVGAQMSADPTKNRVTVYYLLARHFDRLDVFGASRSSADDRTRAAATGVKAGLAAGTGAGMGAMADPAPTGAAGNPPPAPVEPVVSPTSVDSGGGAGGVTRPTVRQKDNGAGMFGIGCIAGLVALGAILLAALISVWASNAVLSRDDPPVVMAAPVTSAVPVAPVVTMDIPQGAGVTATARDGKPMLTVYFDTGKADVAPQFEALSAQVLSYLEANPAATLAISGFNDPTGNAALNEELSRNRAQNVQAALVALGVAQDRTDLVKPDDATTTDMTPEEARRVEIVIVE